MAETRLGRSVKQRQWNLKVWYRACKHADVTYHAFFKTPGLFDASPESVICIIPACRVRATKLLGWGCEPLAVSSFVPEACKSCSVDKHKSPDRTDNGLTGLLGEGVGTHAHWNKQRRKTAVTIWGKVYEKSRLLIRQSGSIKLYQRTVHSIAMGMRLADTNGSIQKESSYKHLSRWNRKANSFSSL